MISNKYGFIFIHPPKTGGTSIHTALHRDLNQECNLATAKDYDNLFKNNERYGTPALPAIEHEDEITHITPSDIDFPWWKHWCQARREEDVHMMKALTHFHETHKLKEKLLLHSYPDAVTNAFGVSGWAGNIKHFPFYVWHQLVNDPRFTQYKSFRSSYTPVATVRNPYKREFSVFLYSKNKFLQDESTGLRKSDISKLIQKEWAAWTDRWQSLDEKSSFTLRPPSSPDTHISSQFSYLITYSRSGPHASWHADNSIASTYTYLRTESLEQDYNNFCNQIGIKIKGPVPHLLNNRYNWKQYVPENIVDWYTDKNIEDVHRIRKQDFEFLGYKKENR